ncbi:ABC transporter ATP-binding protein [Asticcacaulis tiandongensis]|uniref:ABC transporter ATP-binding protein n=1 Tax=Asticcacaulis tiandongensis TaxID=2565365 RepID=UPI00112830B9|nr:ABC transporter ATP-binding protein [Asticcacaulis tiandongensis]
MSDLLHIDKVVRQFGAQKAVNQASLTLKEGEITCLLGPSGCGKSTLLRMIAGLETLDEGTISRQETVLSGPRTHVPPENRGIGFVFQDYALFPHLTISENIGFGLRHLASAERNERIATLLDMVRLSDKAKQYPAALSGGEQQRIALIRALAREPRLILLDEPFSGLDAHLKSEVREATLNVLEHSGAAALVVTHDAEEALSMGHSLALMDKGQIIQTGTPQACYLNPVSIAAARLLGETNLVPARLGNGVVVSGFGRISKADSGQARDVTLCLRPEAFHVVAADTPEAVAVRITESRYHGAYSDLMLEAADGAKAHAHVSSLTAFARNETVSVKIDPHLCSVFD